MEVKQPLCLLLNSVQPVENNFNIQSHLELLLFITKVPSIDDSKKETTYNMEKWGGRVVDLYPPTQLTALTKSLLHNAVFANLMKIIISRKQVSIKTLKQNAGNHLVPKQASVDSNNSNSSWGSTSILAKLN